ncbi:hypothetical protein L7F22_036322 [Adiantum nelumboides]|nr:hypothetical protein [Adiantum nelumboides]
MEAMGVPVPTLTEHFLWLEFLASSGGREYIACGLGGMAGVMAGHPLDTIRIHHQQPKTPASVFSFVYQIHSVGGPLAFLKGMEAPLATIAFQSAITFQAYAHFLWALSGTKEDPASYVKAAIILFDNSIYNRASCYGEINRQDRRLQAQGAPGSSIKYKGIINCFRKSVKEDGFRVLWRGLGTAIAIAFIANGAIFTVYEFAFRFMSKAPSQLT